MGRYMHARPFHVYLFRPFDLRTDVSRATHQPTYLPYQRSHRPYHVAHVGFKYISYVNLHSLILSICSNREESIGG